MARWAVCAVNEGIVDVADVEDREDTRCFSLGHLERVSGGVDAVVGYAWVDEESTPIQEQEDEVWTDDPYDDSESEVEAPSLFDDPIALQLEEDKDDPDFEGVE